MQLAYGARTQGGVRPPGTASRLIGVSSCVCSTANICMSISAMSRRRTAAVATVIVMAVAVHALRARREKSRTTMMPGKSSYARSCNGWPSTTAPRRVESTQSLPPDVMTRAYAGVVAYRHLRDMRRKPLRGFRRTLTQRHQRCWMISSANSLHFTSVAPSINRAKS